MSFSVLAIAAVVVVIVLAVVFSGGSSTLSDVPPETTDADILREARSGNKILAIKWYRSLYGVGLKEAKDAVEKMLKEG